MNEANKPIFFSCSQEELLNEMRKIVKEVVEAINKASNETVQYTVDGLTEKPIFTAKEVCEMLQVTRQTLHMWMKKGVIPKRKINSRLYFLWEDIKKLLEIKNAS